MPAASGPDFAAASSVLSGSGLCCNIGRLLLNPCCLPGAGRMTSETDCCRLERRRKKEEKKSRAAVALQRKLEV